MPAHKKWLADLSHGKPRQGPASRGKLRFFQSGERAAAPNMHIYIDVCTVIVTVMMMMMMLLTSPPLYGGGSGVCTYLVHV